MSTYYKSFKKKIVLLVSCLLILSLKLVNQGIYARMQPLPIIVENEQGNILYQKNCIKDDGHLFYFVIPNRNEYQIWVQVNKGQYLEIGSEKIQIDLCKAKKYQKKIYISFLGKNYLTGEQKCQSYIVRCD